MADYESWNRALATYVTAGVAKGAPVFLSIDEDAIAEIAERFLPETVTGDPLDDYIDAVRARFIAPRTGAVDLRGVAATPGEPPEGVGFLAAMVLAAYNMHDDEGVDETNYFVRLRDLLWLATGYGRPDGMKAGAEEGLWKAWNRYLTAAGFQTTAQRGSASHTYLRYVFSQAILRESDKEHLRQRFSDGRLPPHLDTAQLGGWLSRQAINRKHLKEGLHHPDPGRRWEFYLSAHRVYEETQWEDSVSGRKGNERTAARSIECGLYRIEDLVGDAEYWLFPKQPARAVPAALSIHGPGPGQVQPLRTLRAGFFAPLWPQQPFVEEAIDLAVVGDPGIRTALFPRHDFWLLIRDPEDPFGAWATWRPYLEVGETLLVLCRPGPFAEEMERLHAAKLLEWAEREECPGWIEYRGCMVLSYDWGAFIPTPECRALTDALTPHSAAGVSLSGGLRAPNQNAWLAGYPPKMKVYGFGPRFDVTVTSSEGGEVYSAETPCQVEVPLPAGLEPGAYTAEVNWGDRLLAVRTFRVIPWEVIAVHTHPAEIADPSMPATAGLALQAVVAPGGTQDA
jgi:hypothetical protein